MSKNIRTVKMSSTVLLLAMLFIAVTGTVAVAGSVQGDPGGISVATLNEIGDTLNGLTLSYVCDGTVATCVDGDACDDDGLVDGFINITMTTVGASSSGCDTESESFSAYLEVEGYVTQDLNINSGIYLIGSGNTATSAIQFSYTLNSISAEGTNTDLTTIANTVLMGDDTGEVSCTYYSGAWYCPVPLMYSDGTMIANIDVDGFVQQDYSTNEPSNRVSATDSQVSDSVNVLYGFKLDSVENETGGAITFYGSETIELFTDASCTTPASFIENPTYSGTYSAWYGKINDGTYYTKLGREGMVSSCDTTSITFDGTTQQIPTFTQADGDGLQYGVKLVVNDELGNPVTINPSDFMIISTSGDNAVGNELYLAPMLAGELISYVTGFLSIDTSTADTQLAYVQFASTSQTVITLSGTTPCDSGAEVTAGSSVTCKGLVYTVNSSVYDENLNKVSGATVMANSSTVSCVENGTTGDYYCPVPTASSSDVVIEKNGFVSMSLGTAGTTTNAVVTSNPATGMQYQIKFATGAMMFSDIYGNDLSLDGTEVVTVCTAVDCSATETPDEINYVSGAWYIAPATQGNKYIQVHKSGYVDQIDSGAIVVSASGPQVSPNFYGGESDALQYILNVGTLEDTFGNTITQSAAHSVEVYTDSECMVAATNSTAAFSGSDWNMKPENGDITYYIKYIPGVTTGYASVCHSGVAADSASGSQASAQFTGTDGVPWAIRVSEVQDQFMDILSQDGTETVDVYLDSSCTASATNGSVYYDAVKAEWYMKPEDGAMTYYVKYYEGSYSGYVLRCHSGVLFDGSEQAAASFTSDDSLDWLLGVQTVRDEFGGSLTQQAIDSVYIYKDSACTILATSANEYFDSASSLWYARPTDGDSAYYAKYIKTGYVDKCQVSGVTGTSSVMQAAINFLDGNGDGLEWLIKVATLSDEFGNAIVQDSGDTVGVYTDSSCTVPANDSNLYFYTDSWYARPTNGNITYYTKYSIGAGSGYVDQCSDGIVANAAVGKANESFDGTDGIKWLMKFGTVEDEFGNTLTQLAGDAVTVYTDSTCTTAATGASVYFAPVAGAWYGRPQDGNITYYVKYSKGSTEGYVDVCHSTGAVGDNSTQTTVDFLQSNGDGMSWMFKIGTVEDQFGNSVLQEMGDTVTVWTTADCSTTPATTPGVYYDAVTSAWYAKPGDGLTAYYFHYSKPGYVDMCQSAGMTGDLSAQGEFSFTGSYAFNWLLQYANVEDQFASTLTQSGADMLEVYTDSSCSAYASDAGEYFDAISGMWYAKPTDGDVMYYAKYSKLGYADTCQSTGVTGTSTAAQAVSNLLSANGDGLEWLIKVDTLNDEFGNALTQGADDFVAVYTDSACTTAATAASNTFDGVTMAWYAKPEDGDVTYYTKYSFVSGSGYIDQCSEGVTAVAASGQALESFDSTDGIQWLLKVGNVNDQFGNALAQLAGDSVTVYTDSACTTSATGANEYFDATAVAWYARPQDGDTTYYLKYSRGVTSGYADKCHSSGITGDSSAQSTIHFTASNGDGLDWLLYVNTLDDEFGNVLTQDTSDFVWVYTDSACSIGAVNPDMYFDSTSGAWYAKPENGLVNYYFEYYKDGYIKTCATTAAYGSLDDQTGADFTGADGIAMNTKFRVQPTGTGSDVSGLSTSNIVFTGVSNDTCGSTSNQICPIDFVDNVSTDGYYYAAVSALYGPSETLNIVDVDDDDDPNIDYYPSGDAACEPADSLAVAVQDCGIFSIDTLVDYVGVTAADSTLEAGGSEVLTITLYDDTDTQVTTGQGASKTVTISLSGGSSSPVSAMDIVTTTCANSPVVTGSADTGIDCDVSGGVATIIITDTVVGDGTDITAEADLYSSTFPQQSATNIPASVDVVAGAVDSLAFSLDSPQVNDMPFTGVAALTALDAYSNVVTAFTASSDYVTITSSGGVISGLSGGDVLLSASDFTSGVADLSGSMVYTGNSGAATINATAVSGASGSAVVTINAGSGSYFDLVLSPQANNVAFSGTNTIIAKDVSGNVATDFDASIDNVTITTDASGYAITGLGSGLSNVLDQAADFVSGVADLSALGALYTGTAGNFVITAISSSEMIGTGSITINPGALDHFSPSLVDQSNLSAFTGVNTLTAMDVSDNVITSFDASVNNVTVTADASSYMISGLGTGMDNVMDQASDFLSGVADLTALGMFYVGNSGAVTFTFTSSDSKTGSGMINIAPGSITSFDVVAAPTSLTVGNSTTVTVTALDVSNNIIESYNNVSDIDITTDAGDVTIMGSGITDTGVNAILASGNFVSGVATFNISNTVVEGPVSVTVTENDTGMNYTGSTTVSGTGISWTPGSAYSFEILDPVDTTAGVPAIVTIRLLDMYGNIVTTDSTTSVTLALDGSAVVDATAVEGTVLSGGGTGAAVLQVSAGQAVVSISDDIAESVAITLSSPSDPALDVSSSQDIVVSPGAYDSLVMVLPGEAFVTGPSGGKSGTPSNQVAGVGFGFGLYAVDANNNVVDTVSNNVTITSDDAYCATDPTACYFDTLTLSYGVGSFASATNAYTAGAVNITVQDASTGYTDSAQVNIDANSATGYVDLIAAVPAPDTTSVSDTTLYFNERGLEVLRFETTSATDTTAMALADGAHYYPVTAVIFDSWGNAVPSVDVELYMEAGPGTLSGLGTATTSLTGTAEFTLSTTAAGTYSISALYPAGDGSPVGVSMFDMVFRVPDVTSPVLTQVECSGGSFVLDGDGFQAGETVNICFSAYDDPADSSMLDPASPAITIDGASDPGASCTCDE
mgnify:CR=1 FL=1